MHARTLLLPFAALLAFPAPAAANHVATPGCDEPVFARIAFAPQIARAGGEQHFTASDSSPLAPCARSIAWDLDDDGAFDDGTGVTATRTYPAGRALVSVRVTDGSGRASVARRSFPVLAGNLQPYLGFVMNPYDPLAGQTISFDGFLGDYDSISETVDLNLDADPAAEHQFFNDDPFDILAFEAEQAFAAGTHRVTARGVDDLGGDAFETVTFSIPATAGANSPPQMPTGGVPSLMVAGRTHDLSFAFSDPEDGNVPDSGVTWDLDGDGQYDDATGINIQRSFATGEVVIGVRAVDSAGATLTLRMSRQVTGEALPPVWLSHFLNLPARLEVGESATLNVPGMGFHGGSADVDWDTDGDGEFDDSPTVEFDEAGEYEVSFRVTSDDAVWIAETRTILVGDQPAPDPDPDDGGGSGGTGGTGGQAPSVDPPRPSAPPVVTPRVTPRPGLGLTMHVGAQRLRDVLRRGVRVRLLARGSGTVRLVARLNRRLARRLGLSAQLGSVVVSLQPGVERFVRIRLSRQARRVLARRNARRLPLSVSATRLR